MIYRIIFFSVFPLLLLKPLFVCAQTSSISGYVKADNTVLIGVYVQIFPLKKGAITNEQGYFEIGDILPGKYGLKLNRLGYEPYYKDILIEEDTILHLDIIMKESASTFDEVVVTGTMKMLSRSESPVPVEVIRPVLFQKNPTPSLFEAVGMINGVQPQINCNVCNTGDIHINGMEGPYTMILIDGMPIVSALSSVYGLSGTPNSLVERIEVVKGPASSLYGSEAMGGIINVFTKDPTTSPIVSADVFTTSWGEINTDLGVRLKAGKKTAGLLGINYFHYDHPLDNNNDGFTDLTLQQRVSVFNKWSFVRPSQRKATLAGRYVYEDRWGGEMNWNETWRGSDSIYAESIYTRRAELIGMYELPLKEKVMTQFSYNWHDQNSWYGNIPFMARQQVAFMQAFWDKDIGSRHAFLLGSAYRFTYYDDNSPATASEDGLKNQPVITPLPGIFVQDQWKVSGKLNLLSGYRLDHDLYHGLVHSPRLALKYDPGKNSSLRLSLGSGFRVVNLFTEDHAALSGAREIVIAEALEPERSKNSNLNYLVKVYKENYLLTLDISGFYSHFSNKIVADFDTDPQQIIYANLRGYGISRGLSANIDMAFKFPLKVLAGVSYMDVYQVDNAGLKTIQLHAPKWSANGILTYVLPKSISIDLTAILKGPMRLPVLPGDFRPEYSPWFCVANIQLTRRMKYGLEIYGGLKNILNFVPKNPIMRPHDPFDKHVDDPVDNPMGYTFDPSYNYTSLQGIRGFIGMRYKLF